MARLSGCDRYLLRVAAEGELNTSYAEFRDAVTKSHIRTLSKKGFLRKVGKTGYELVGEGITMSFMGQLKGGRASDCV